MLDISRELESHAAECRAMATAAYDPQFKSALMRMAGILDCRARELGDKIETAWLQHALAPSYSRPIPQFFH